MRCDEFNERLHQLLDRRLPVGGDQRLATHASECGECRRALRGWESLEVVLSEAERPAPPADLAARVLAEVAPPAAPEIAAETVPPVLNPAGIAERGPAAQRSRRVHWAAWLAPAVALAAMLLVAVTVLVRQEAGTTDQALTEGAPGEGEVAAGDQGGSSSRPESLAIARPAQEATPPAESPAVVSAHPTEETEHLRYSDWVARFSQDQANAPYLHQSTWVEPVSATVRPITASFQSAIDHPVPRPIVTTFTTAINAVRESEPKAQPLAPDPQSSLPRPTNRLEAQQGDLSSLARLS